MSVSNCLIDNNAIGVSIADGSVFSRGNNTMIGNGTNVSGTLTPLAGH